MSRQVRHLSRMVDDLLEVSRIRQGKIRLLRQPLDLGLLLSQTVEAAQSLLSHYERHLEVALPPEPLIVDGDATRLLQLVMNLLGNATKYTDEGGHIWISLEREADQAVLRVKDDGKGIPADELTAIFELFVQGETSIDRPHGGLGLGLAVAKQIALGHQGHIQARSGGPGQGSEFILRLPLLTQETIPSVPEAEAPRSPAMRYGC
ncbi:sensor histidine kinase [Spirosoma rhododendri]|uniref:sensor histidine kinase n=1 Tax=Spirosoma rhododendri TaxID=2728024 RepID=UPI0020C54197|nr:HAMP domain-containing sensor histidine kinase [Spirosoma rhododendri]